MSHDHDSDDLKLLGEMKALAPVDFRGFLALDNFVGRDDGAIPTEKAGATRTEIAETALITAALRAGAAVTHGALALKIVSQKTGNER